jgi:ribosomal-protein-alanine N-acetyltransferase
MAIPEVHTDRLLLRGIRAEDVDVYQELFTDPEVIRYLPLDGPIPREQLEGVVERSQTHWDRHGYGVWIVFTRDGDFVGQCGLRYLEDIGDSELLYTTGRDHWNRGLTTEAARASVAFGFERGGLQRIVAFAVPENRASTRVMEKIGMQLEGEQDIFGLHCARYGIAREDWESREAG